MELKKKAIKNTSVTRGTKDNQEVLKEGVPNDASRKHLTQAPLVGVSIGSTLNMGDYQSLRVDVWLSDNVGENETTKEAYERVISTVSQVLEEVVAQYTTE